jgi:hypothetical protein
MNDLVKQENTKVQEIDKANQELEGRFKTDLEGNVITDDNGLPVFRDKLAMKITDKDLHFMWGVLKDLMEYNIEYYEKTLEERKAFLASKRNGSKIKAYGQHIVPEEEVEKVFTLMQLLAEQEKFHDRQYMMELPSNYFFGLWKVFQEVRKHGVYEGHQGKTS